MHPLTLKMIVAIGVLSMPLPAMSQNERPGERWYFAETTEFMTNVAWNLSIVDGRVGELGVECTPEGPVVYFADGVQYQGDTRPAGIAISIDGQDLSRGAIFEPHGHTSWWRMSPSDGLLTELQAGSIAVLQGDLGTGAFSFKLRDSNAAIGAVINVCGSENAGITQQISGSGGEDPAPEGGGLTTAVLERRIQSSCQGSYSGDGAIVEGNIDGDGVPDYLIDWDKVSCSSNAVGRGGGYCGMQMCTIDVYASSVYQPDGLPQPILAYSYELAAPGGDYVMNTTISGSGCPITHRCTRYWGWTGSKLEVIREENVDMSNGGDGALEETATEPARPSLAQAPEPAASASNEGASAEVEENVTSEASEDDIMGTDDLDERNARAGIIPGQWLSMVPEGAMGFVLSMYFVDRESTEMVSLYCSEGSAMTVGIGSPELVYENPNFSTDDEVVIRLSGEDFPIAFHEIYASRNDRPYYDGKGPWDGQHRFVQLLNEGADFEVVVYPDGNRAAARAIFTIPGSANDPGLTHVNEVCGNGAEAPGPVESFPGMDVSGQSGEWMLRDRTENFVVPVAYTINRRNGASFRLLCSEDGVPSMQIMSQFMLDGEKRTITLVADGQEFQFEGYGVQGSVVFPFDAGFAEAIARGGDVTHIDTLEDHPDDVFPTAGFQGAMDFAYAPCR